VVVVVIFIASIEGKSPKEHNFKKKLFARRNEKTAETT
jgi:hypothetical protein